MSTERITDKIEIDDNDAPPAASVQKPEAPQRQAKPEAKPTDEKPDGTEYVELEDPKVKARFQRLYRHQKEAAERAERNERSMQLLAAQNKKLYDAVEKLVGETASRKTAEELKVLRQEAKDALASGDTETFTQVNERLIEIKAEEKAATKPAEKEEGESDSQEASTTEIRILQAWQSQAGRDGKPVRPWAIPGHPEFQATQDMLRRIAGHPNMKEASVREILAEVDRRMRRVLDEPDPEQDEGDEDEGGGAVRRAFSQPRPAGRPNGGSQDKTILNAEEKTIAEAMFLGGRGAPAKNIKEAHDLYLKQKRAIGRVVAVED